TFMDTYLLGNSVSLNMMRVRKGPLAARSGRGPWHSPPTTANNKQHPGTLSSRVPRPRRPLELVFLDLLAEGVPVDPEILGGPREVAPVPLQHARDEALLELAARVGEEDSPIDHLRNQRLQLL